MAKLMCENCNYRFESKKDESQKCPYCGKNSLIKEPSAEELLENEE